MSRRGPTSVLDVAERRLCCGCGGCAGVEPGALEMVDVTAEGRRPRVREGAAANGDLPGAGAARRALAVCPGHELAHDRSLEAEPGGHGLIDELRAGWGPVLALWEGWASDEAIRFAGSSGGAATAIAAYCLEQRGAHGVLHTGARDDKPYLNRTVLSTTRAELLERTGSRYAPASPAEGIPTIKAAPGPCVFIGKPCDVVAVRKARRLDPELDAKLALTIGFFCAGTPSTGGTLAMLRRMGIDDPDRIVSLRYRGNGWPGLATAELRTPDGGTERRTLTYDQSWGEVLTKHVQWRCRVCADHTGEFADVAVGDPWYRPPAEGEPGRSLILARTRRGLEAIEGAIAAGYIVVEPREPGVLPASQPNLLRTRGAVWGRSLGSRLAGASAPRYGGMPTWRFWLSELSAGGKLQSVLGAAKRVLQRGRRERGEG